MFRLYPYRSIYVYLSKPVVTTGYGCGKDVERSASPLPRPTESLAALGAIVGTAAVRCDVAAPVTTGAKLLRNGLENVTFTGH